MGMKAGLFSFIAVGLVMSVPVLGAQVLSASASAQELRVIAGGGSAPAADALIPGFEKATGAKVKIEYTSGGGLRDRVLKGEVFDVGLVPTEALGPLTEAKKLVVASKVSFADARLAFVVKKGAAKAPAATLELFQAALTNAKTLAYPDPKSGASVGILFAKAIEQWAPSWGIAEDLAKKTRLTPALSDVAVLLKSGEADLGVLLTTQIAADPELEMSSLLPAELRLSNLYVAYVMSDSKQADLAAKFVAWLTTPAAAEIVRSKGFEQKN